MTSFQQLDKALRARGWRYDIGEEQFFDSDGKIVRSHCKLLALVPGITLDHLVSCQDDKWGRSPQRRKVQAAYRALAKRINA